MKETIITKEKIAQKVKNLHPMLLPEAIEKVTERLMNAEDILVPNLEEWIQGKKLTDIWVRDRYSIGSVMYLWGTTDFISAFIALDDYAKDESAESRVWAVRR